MKVYIYCNKQWSKCKYSIITELLTESIFFFNEANMSPKHITAKRDTWERRFFTCKMNLNKKCNQWIILIISSYYLIQVLSCSCSPGKDLFHSFINMRTTSNIFIFIFYEFIIICKQQCLLKFWLDRTR